MEDQLQSAASLTAEEIKTAYREGRLDGKGELSPPEVEAVVERVSRVIPAGSVPGMILGGLARLQGRKLPEGTSERDVNLLFRGLEQTLEKAAYMGLFAGPATVIWAYQNLLKLAGVDARDAFPDGMWQFYVTYALREDTARHTNETHGFDTILEQHQIFIDRAERMAAWVMAAIHCLCQYDELLANTWRERVYTHELRQAARHEQDAAFYGDLYRQWTIIRPYARGEDAQEQESFSHYRLNRFLEFLSSSTLDLPESIHKKWLARLEEREDRELAAYVRQLSILAYLDPGNYGESRTAFPLERARVGVIYQGNYYLFPVLDPASGEPAQPETVMNQVAALLAEDAPPGVSLAPLAKMPRANWNAARRKLDKLTRASLEELRYAPILINFDLRPRHLPLAKLRQTERGVGDHALTLFDTGETMVFDQSHIFFDGAWGAAFAEIMTNEALSWAVYLNRFPPDAYEPQPPRQLVFGVQPEDLLQFSDPEKTSVEAWAETNEVIIRGIFFLRTLFKRRSDLINLTVNDLMVLYRAIHAVTYQPSTPLARKLKNLLDNPKTRPAAEAAVNAIQMSQRVNPSILIPVDASLGSPRERIHPMSFEVPLQSLDLLQLHERSLMALDAYERGSGDRSALYARFDELQRSYLLALAGFGEVLSRVKEIATHGETDTMSSLKLLAHMPAPLQRLLDRYSGSFEWMNDMIKGREVFSNIGKVSHTSTLSRFMTAKDDNDKKDLAWGILTDKDDNMHITLRDFRPHVAVLASHGEKFLADDMAQDYLDAYARGLNQYIAELHRITVASRETRINRKDLGDELETPASPEPPAPAGETTPNNRAVPQP
jgi:hypothetical protein